MGSQNPNSCQQEFNHRAVIAQQKVMGATRTHSANAGRSSLPATQQLFTLSIKPAVKPQKNLAGQKVCTARTFRPPTAAMMQKSANNAPLPSYIPRKRNYSPAVTRELGTKMNAAANFDHLDSLEGVPSKVQYTKTGGNRYTGLFKLFQSDTV